MNNVYKHCQNRHGFRGKREDVEVDQELMASSLVAAGKASSPPYGLFTRPISGHDFAVR